MNKIIDNLKSRVDLKFHWVCFLPLIILLLTYPAMKYLPIKYTYENSLIENFQLIVLFITFIFCKKSKCDKNFFNFLALVIIILFLREINCGRTIFFPVEGLENTFYSWKDIKYGYLVHPLYGAFIFGSFLYFILSKGYRVLFQYIKSAKISLYNWVFLLVGIIFGTIGEKMGSFALEEMMETVFYLSLFALIYLQGQNNEYIKK